MVKVKCIVSYNDLQLNRLITLNEELKVTNERAKELVDKGLVSVIEVIPEEVKKEEVETPVEEKEIKPKTTVKKTTAKKTSKKK